jgi:ferric-dicitrate binding protein FerR (iron transport regulator)
MKMLKIGILNLVLVSFSLVAQEADTAIVTFLVGKVSVKTATDTKWKPLKKEDSVGSGDTIMTGNGSAATITYRGSEFKIAANSTLVVNSLYSKDKDGAVELKNGSAWFKVANLSGKKFTATTPTSVAGVRGTAFATLYDEKSKSGMNCVCEGKVEVTSTEAGAKPKLVEKGSGSSLKMGSADIDISSYKNLIVKKESMPEFESKVKESPMLKNCLSCHTPKGWTAPGIMKDDKYGK